MIPEDYTEFVSQLRLRLQGLDGKRSRGRSMEPELSYGRHRGPAPPRAKPAAVVALFYPHRSQPTSRDEWHLPFIVRPHSMADHAGQVSFPGGAREPGETAEQCALRELEEELGGAANDIAVLGRLSPVWVFASCFYVQPVVASVPVRPDFRPNPCEVAQLLEVPVSHLLDPSQRSVFTIQRRSLTFRAPSILFGGYHIWGATGIMLSGLLGLIPTFVAP
jgi:8-oxo-dGTP pyrophosphatase MutT (NUDIX family)